MKKIYIVIISVLLLTLAGCKTKKSLTPSGLKIGANKANPSLLSTTTTFKVVLYPIPVATAGDNAVYTISAWMDTTFTPHQISQVYYINMDYGTEITYTNRNMDSIMYKKVTDYAVANGYTISRIVNYGVPGQADFNETDVQKINYIKNKPASLAARTFNNAPSHSIVTTAAAANGFQLSTTRDANVGYSVNIVTTTQIGIINTVDGSVVLEIAATNSTTATDWKEIGRVRNKQVIGLALALSITHELGGELVGIVPAGWYCRLRSINTSGTPTYTYISGQEALE